MNRYRHEIEKKIEIKRTRGRLESSLSKLENDRKYYVDKAKQAKLEGDSARYGLARSGLASTLAQIKRLREMLLNIDITSQMRDTGVATREFLSGVESIFKSVAKLNKNIRLKETRSQLRAAMSGTERMQLSLESILTEAETSFSGLAAAQSTVPDSEIDAMLEAEAALSGDAAAHELDGVIKDVPRAVEAEKRGNKALGAAGKVSPAPPVYKLNSAKLLEEESRGADEAGSGKGGGEDCDGAF